MKVIAILFVLLLVLAPGVAQKPLTPLQEMVQTEQAFSRTAAEQNTRAAFMEFIADDGVLFRPEAVNGKKWMREHPEPPSAKHPLLAWQPIFAGMAAAGDLGFTTGPWEFKADVKDAQPSRYGHFVTVWKKQRDGSWRFVVDLGISHQQSGGPQVLWMPPLTTSRPPVRNLPLDAIRDSLIGLDRALSEGSVKRGFEKAFIAQSASDIRLYREGSLPFVGRPAAAHALTSVTGQVSWSPAAADVAHSGDLGYTRGSYQITEANDAKKVIEQGSYLRIWRYESGGVWRIVLDVANAN